MQIPPTLKKKKKNGFPLGLRTLNLEDSPLYHPCSLPTHPRRNASLSAYKIL